MFKKIFVCLIGLTCTAQHTIGDFLDTYDQYNRQRAAGIDNTDIFNPFTSLLGEQFQDLSLYTTMRIYDDINEKHYSCTLNDHTAINRQSIPQDVLNATLYFTTNNQTPYSIWVQLLQPYTEARYQELLANQ